MRLYSSLPESITINGVILKPLVGTGKSITELKSEAHDKNKKYRVIHVLAINLRGKTDLHRSLYKPTAWFFTEF